MKLRRAQGYGISGEQRDRGTQGQESSGTGASGDNGARDHEGGGGVVMHFPTLYRTDCTQLFADAKIHHAIWAEGGMG